ncbi:hypothetical protein FX984_00939 [Pseudomonas marginalis]|nr:hypothetical protein FX984_00939 [Pseudomonas marginalis]
MHTDPNVGGGYTPMTLYLQLRHRLILSLRMSRLMYIAPNVGGGYTPMTLYLQLRHRLILSLRMSRLMYIAPNVGGGLPPMRECQLTHLPLTHRYRGVEP